MGKMDLVVLGTVALDTIETPFGKMENILGGSATYFSLAARLFTKTGIIGVVGNDFPEKHIKFLESHGIDLAGLEKSEDEKTFRWEGYYEYDMNQAHTLKTELNALAAFRPKIPEEYRRCRFLFLANTDPEIQLRVLEEIKPQYSFCDTMNFWIQHKREHLDKVLEKVDMVVINDGEARQYCNTPNIIKAGRTIMEKSKVKRIIIKKGEHGALFFNAREGFFSVPAYPLEKIVDPTGAGDSFAGGTVGHLAKHGVFDDASIRKSMVCGSVIASYVVEDFGTERMKDLTEREIQHRYDRFKEIVAFDHQV